MKHITEAEVQKVAHLSRIGLNDEELHHYTQDLEHIFGLMQQLENANLNNIEPLSHPGGQTLRTREDCVTEEDQHEKFQKIAPKVEEALYLVPPVIE